MRLFRKRTISWRRGGARRCWDRAAAARPAGGASDAFRLGLAVVIVAVSVPVMRANSAVELGILKPEERTGANRSVQATFLRSPTPLRGNAPDGAVPGQRMVMGALARQAWVPSECSTSTRAELGQGCWRRAWLGHLLAAAKLCRRRGGRQRAPGHLGGGVASRPVPSQLGRRRQRV